MPISSIVKFFPKRFLRGVDFAFERTTLFAPHREQLRSVA